jgi:hypothetical protein
MKISRKPTPPPRPTAPSRPPWSVTADAALARAKISGMGLGGPERLVGCGGELVAHGVALFLQGPNACSNQIRMSAAATWPSVPRQIAGKLIRRSR